MRAPKNRPHARGTRAALIGMGILIIWILLCGAYAWSVWNLAQMARSRVSGATPVASFPSSEVQQIELVGRSRSRGAFHPRQTPAAARSRPNCGSLGGSLRFRGDSTLMDQNPEVDPPAIFDKPRMRRALHGALS